VTVGGAGDGTILGCLPTGSESFAGLVDPGGWCSGCRGRECRFWRGHGGSCWGRGLYEARQYCCRRESHDGGATATARSGSEQGLLPLRQRHLDMAKPPHRSARIRGDEGRDAAATRGRAGQAGSAIVGLSRGRAGLLSQLRTACRQVTCRLERPPACDLGLGTSAA
jgi:hypothetical protein